MASAGSSSVSPGSLTVTPTTNSAKIWTYFTSDNSAPDGNQPHNSVLQMGVGDTLTASLTFSVQGITSAGSRNFRLGLFFDPTNARVQTNTNSDGGGTGNPWQDASGYSMMIPVNTGSGSNPIRLTKRTVVNNSLLGSDAAHTLPANGGATYSLANDVTYTASLSLYMVSATQMDVTGTLALGNTILSTLSYSDLGATFGGAAPPSGTQLPNASSVYTNFDQLFIRLSDNSQFSDVIFSNFRVEYITAIPEASSFLLFGLVTVLGGGAAWRRRRR
ncbi:MAG TPA: PEP-CTERM sorting domain-containing protein [Lacipirellulaceae bacterium]|nr:PEP-CTERM sorting domain-containing protein [Lacipirellulaceae bacterium]HMP06507.1 PEP-CTERM sorting domain-containing protein [Lacipirellulaceae bacterium]